MKFCRNCGSSLAQPVAPPPMAPPGLGPGIGSMAGPSMGTPMVPPATSPGPSVGTPVIPSQGPLIAGPFPIPDGSGRPGPGPAAVPPTMISEHRPGGAVRPGPGSAPAAVTCPRCGTAAQPGFAFCQQCGLHLQGVQPTDLGAARPRPPSVAPPVGRPPTAANQPPIDPQAATLASDGLRAGPLAIPAGAAPRPQAGPAWGTAILVNRDGSDGQRYPLSGEYLIIGRAGSDIAFEDDRFLGRQHARLERSADGAVSIVPIDALNGVFRKADAPIELGDGMLILVGREVLRYERVEPEEMKLHPLVRHGVALFGSPPREPWGRLLQVVPNGGYRDVRHLAAEEVVLGREEGDIVFRDDAFMSRRHAALTWDGQRAQITDLGSSNGTFVRITGPTPLRHGDHVRMGDQLLRIELGR
jgi:pSer/pThr/pTyr-binding forkhead associated (FHA) protein